MQHLDEGTIHSWLDGALSAEEAARAEAHVKECAQCQAAVAEARGFIAASSRILTALDNAPRGVVPAAMPKRRHGLRAWVSGVRPADPMWRVAAAVLVVAGGTLLVVRNNEVKQPAVLPSRATTAATQQLPMSDATQPTTMRAVARPSALPRTSQQKSQRPGTAFEPIGGQAPALENSGRNAAAPVAGPVVGAVAAPQPVAAAVALSSGRRDAAAKRTNRVEVNELAAEFPSVRVVDVRRPLGQRITFYEVARGDTVQLAESLGAVDQVVVTGMSVTRAAAGGAAPTESPRMLAAKPPAVDTSTAGQMAAAAATPPPAGQAIFTASPGGINTLTWTDPTTARVMRLSGRRSRAELEEIRRSIERVRAAAADSVRK